MGLSWTGWSVGGPPTQAGIQSDVDQVKYLWMQNHIKSPSRESLLHRVSSCLVMVHHCSSFLIYGSVKVRQASHAESVSGTQPLVPYQAAIESALKFFQAGSCRPKPAFSFGFPFLHRPLKNIKEPSIMDSPWAWPNVHHCLRCSKESSMNWTLATC